MKPTRRFVRRSFISEVTGGFGKPAPTGGGAAEPMPATDSDLHLAGTPKPAAGDSDR